MHHWPTPHPSEVIRVSLSVDGSRLVSAGKKGSIRVHDCRKPYLELGSFELGCQIVDLDCSPEGSILAVACGDDRIRIVDAGPGEPLSVHELSLSDKELEFEDTAWVRIYPEMNCVLSGDKANNVAYWDLSNYTLLKYAPDSAKEESTDDPNGEENSETYANSCKVSAMGQFLRLGKGGVSADGHIALHEGQQLYIDGEEVDDGYYSVPAENARLVADGRVIWGYGSGVIRGVDLLAREEIESIDDRTQRFDPGRSQLVNTLDRMFEELLASLSREKPDSVSRVLFAKLVETPPADSESALTNNQTTSVAYTPDFRICIDVADKDDTPIDSLYRVSLLDEEKVEYIQISPCGQRAFVLLPSRWIVWDIRTGRQVASNRHDTWDSSVVLPDWKCVASLVAGWLKVFDLSNGSCLVDTQLDTSGRLYVTLDGRRLIVSGPDGIRLWNVAETSLMRGELPATKCSHVLISPAANFLFCADGDQMKVFDLESGKNSISQICVRDPLYWGSGLFGEPWMDTDGTVVADFLDEDTPFRKEIEYELQLKIRSPSGHRQPEAPVVTPTRVFRYDSNDNAIQTAFFSAQPLPGQPDLQFTVACPHCGKRSLVPQSAEDAIDTTIYLADLPDALIPCLHLPNEAWEKPELRCQCEHCRKPLRLNPFVAFE